MAKTSIVNVVATATLGPKLDFEELAKHPQILARARLVEPLVKVSRITSFLGI